MPFKLDRAGLFKANIKSWGIKEAKSGAIAVNIEFGILSMKVPGEDAWEDWSGYDAFVYGDFWVIGKNGMPNESAVKQLVECLAWTGELRDIQQGPPAVVVQVLVNEEEYDGKTYFKATWMNPEDYVGGPNHADDGEVAAMSTRFGSMLRASASAARAALGNAPAAAKGTAAPAKAPGGGTAKTSAATAPEPPAPGDEDLPF